MSTKKIKIDPKKIRKIEPTKSTVQAVIFGKGWKTKDARAWLKNNKFKPKGKVNKTKNGTLKYNILDASDFDKLGFKKTNKGVSFIIGVNRKVQPSSSQNSIDRDS